MNRFDPRRLRRTVLDLAYFGSTTHIPCAFSLIEVVSVLYSKFLRYPGDRWDAEQRDYLVLSKGHGVMALYACFREMGWLTEDDVKNYCKDGTLLKGLSDSRVPGLEVTSGSLGHGLSVGMGLALGAKRNCTAQRVFAIVGDGEMNEGPIWEAALFAAHHKLDNVIIIVDANGFQAMGRTVDVMNLGDIAAKFAAFGFESVSVDGHDLTAVENSLTMLLSTQSGKPKALVANTVKGKGVSFMEHNNIWHYSRLDAITYEKAIQEIEQRP